MAEDATKHRIVTDPRSLEPHPVCMMFPQLTDAQQDKLAESIRRRGLLQKIVLWRGQIIDGRNRWICALNAGFCLTDDHFEVWGGEECDLYDFVWELNGDDCRRHLTASQLAAIAVELKKAHAAVIAEEKREKCSEAGKAGGRGNRKGGEEKGSPTSCLTLSAQAQDRHATRRAAKQVGVNHEYVRIAEKVEQASPEAFEEVKQGRKSLKAAAKEAGVLADKPKGRCRINGVEQDDTPEIAEQRRKGRIPSGVLIDVQVPESVTTAEGVREEYEERAAIRDDLSDDDWLASLPLASSLEDQQLATFREDALAYRALQQATRVFSRHAAMVLNKTRRDGAYKWRLRSFLKVEPPDRWKVCPKVDGGCDGRGFKSFGTNQHECPRCHGRGYWING